MLPAIGTVLLSGCVTDGITPTLTKSAGDWQATLTAAEANVTHERRTASAYSLSVDPSRKSDAVSRTEFVEFACQGVEAYKDQQVGLATIGQFSSTVDTLTAPAGSDFSAVFSSIIKYDQTVAGLKPGIAGDGSDVTNTKAGCIKATGDDLDAITKPVPLGAQLQGKSLLAVGDIVSTGKALFSAVETAALGIAQEVDEIQRWRRFASFIQDAQTISTLHKVLGGCAIPQGYPLKGESADIDKANFSDSKKLTVKDFTHKCVVDNPKASTDASLSDAHMTDIITQRRRAALIVPYEMSLAIKIPLVSQKPVSRASYLDEVSKLDAALASFDSLRTLAIDGQQESMANAINDLYRLSKGDLTAKETRAAMWAAIQELSGRFKGASANFGDVETKANDLVNALKKL